MNDCIGRSSPRTTQASGAGPRRPKLPLRRSLVRCKRDPDTWDLQPGEKFVRSPHRLPAEAVINAFGAISLCEYRQPVPESEAVSRCLAPATDTSRPNSASHDSCGCCTLTCANDDCAGA